LIFSLAKSLIDTTGCTPSLTKKTRPERLFE
jgi:hypothetical protein